VNFLAFNAVLLAACIPGAFIFSIGLVALLSPPTFLFGMKGDVSATLRKPVAKAVTHLFFGLAAAFQVYFWGLWAAFCVAYTSRFTQKPEVTWLWAYWLSAFFWCTGLMGYLAHGDLDKEDQDRGGFTGIAIYFLILVGSFLVFAFFRGPMISIYGWFLSGIGLA
jgi:hypothetical protein